MRWRLSAACARLVTPSWRNSRETWFFTVCSATPRAWAIDRTGHQLRAGAAAQSGAAGRRRARRLHLGRAGPAAGAGALPAGRRQRHQRRRGQRRRARRGADGGRSGWRARHAGGRLARGRHLGGAGQRALRTAARRLERAQPHLVALSVQPSRHQPTAPHPARPHRLRAPQGGLAGQAVPSRHRGLQRAGAHLPHRGGDRGLRARLDLPAEPVPGDQDRAPPLLGRRLLGQPGPDRSSPCRSAARPRVRAPASASGS